MTDRVINESSKRITCGWEGYPGHKGVDLGWRGDESQNIVHANCKGVVESIQDGLDKMPGATGVQTWGNFVLVRHDNGMKTRYAHLRKGTIKVAVGQAVDENTELAVIGDSGKVTARHLHFEVYSTSGSRINPTEYLTKPVCNEPAPAPAPTPTPQPEPAPVAEFKVGDRVVVSGYATADSDGNGTRTANYGGNANNPSDIRYITKITDLSKPRPYHISSGNTFGIENKGWVSKSQIKKI